MKKILAQFILLISFLSISQLTIAQGCSSNNSGNMLVDGKYYFKVTLSVLSSAAGQTWNITGATGGDMHILPLPNPQALPINMPESGMSFGLSQYLTEVWVLSGESIDLELTSPDAFGVTLYTTIGGCTHVLPPTAIIETNEPCPGGDLILMETGTGGTQWAWTGPDGFSSNQQNPIISNPTTANTGDYTVSVTNEGGTTTETLHIEIPEAFSFDFDNATQTTQTSTGLNVYAIEVCGGAPPYSMDFDATGGFANSNLLLSNNLGCQTLQITYTNGVEWTASITDANDCSNESSTISSDDLGGTPLLMIDGFDVVKETGANKLDGELTVNVSGGDDSCSDYTYDWSGPSPSTTTNNTGSTTGNTLTGLSSGSYSVTVTDCDGNTVVGSQYLNRATSRRGRGRKTALNTSISSKLQLYPNPAADFVQIDYHMTKQTGETTISITDLAGRNLWTQIIEEKEGHLELPLSDFNSGLYIVTMRVDNELIGKEKLLIMK